MMQQLYTAKGKFDQSDVMKQYAPLVRRLALQMIARLPSSVELDDLVQAGMLGLLDAASRYQDNLGAQFETYASQRIRGAMLDELRANDSFSRSLRKSARGVATAIQTLEQKLGRGATETEIAQELNMPLEQYQQLLQEIHGCQLVYYEDFDSHNSENTFIDRECGESAGSRDANEPLNRLLERDMRQALVAAIEALPERERLLLSLYYEQELNLREIGEVMGVTQSRVCQLHSQAINRLRARVREDR